MFILYIYTLRTHSHAQLTHTRTCNHTQSLTIAPGDYGALTGFSLGPFNNSVRQLTFSVPIVNDVIPEDDETFIANLTLLPADQARLRNRVTVQPDSATVTILDDDGTIAIDKSQLLEVHDIVGV